MIQRIQTIFLIIVAAAMFSMLFIPIWGKTSPETGEVMEITAMQLSYTQDGKPMETMNTMYSAVLAVLSSILAVGSIFSYRNRLKQIKLNFANALVISVIIGINVYLVFQGDVLFDEERPGSPGFGFFMPAVALVFNSLANRFIRRDEKMVRSADRLR